jgi:cell division protease FtsH
MVTVYGMSSKLGAVKYGTSDSEPFLGRDYGHQRDYSEDIAADIDAEVRNLIEGAHDEAWEILVQYRDVLDAMVLELAEKETLAKEDLERILAPVRKRPPHNSFSGFGKRTPSDRPPIEIPPSLRRSANGANGNGANGNGANGNGANGNGAYGPNGNGAGWNQPAAAGAASAPSYGNPPAAQQYSQPAPYGPPASSVPSYGQPAYGTAGAPAPFGTQPGYGQPTPAAAPPPPATPNDADGFSPPQYNQPQDGPSYPPPTYPAYPERSTNDPDGGPRDEV